MYIALNAWNFPQNTPLDEMLRATAGAGFAGLELTIDETGPITFETSQAECADIRGRLIASKLRLPALACGAFWRKHYASPDIADRHTAINWTRAALERAAWLGTDTLLIVPAVVGRFDEPTSPVREDNARHLAREALLDLQYDAEACGVVLACENVWNRFLQSPVETREFLDALSTSWVAAYLDLGNALAFADVNEWIRVLGPRIQRVHIKDYSLKTPGRAGFVPMGEGDIDWPAALSSLHEARYHGPLTYEGRGDPQEIRKRIQQTLKM